MGKMLLKTDCSPASSRSWGRTRICRKRSYEFFWISIRLGMGIEVLIFAKSIRSRFTFFVAVDMFVSAPQACGGWPRSNAALRPGETPLPERERPDWLGSKHPFSWHSTRTAT